MWSLAFIFTFFISTWKHKETCHYVETLKTKEGTFRLATTYSRKTRGRITANIQAEENCFWTAFPQSPKTRKACTMVTRALIPCKAWDHNLTATFLVLCRVFFVEPQALGRRCSTWHSLLALSVSLLCHSGCTCTGRVGPQAALDGVRWVQRDLKAWTCCQRQLGTATQGKAVGMLKRLTISGLKTTVVYAFLKFWGQKERGRTKDISKSQYEKKSCSSGYKAASSGRHRHFRSAAQLPASPTTWSSSGLEMGPDCQSDVQQPSLCGSALHHGPIARVHSNSQGNSCLIFGERKSTLKPPPVRAHHPDKQWLCSVQQDGVDQQGKCSHKHRLFILFFSFGSRCLAQPFSAFQPSPQRQNDYLLKETAT